MFNPDPHSSDIKTKNIKHFITSAGLTRFKGVAPNFFFLHNPKIDLFEIKFFDNTTENVTMKLNNKLKIEKVLNVNIHDNVH